MKQLLSLSGKNCRQYVLTQSTLRQIAILLLLFLLGSVPAAFGQVILSADGVTPAYTKIKGVLHASPETPDCSHPSFGPHITQVVDRGLKKYVFDFNIHVTPDNDRCKNFDRQRLEIKTEGNSSTPDYLKGFLGDTVTFRWKLKLPEGFQPSYSFTHIHQIKAYDGDAGAPLITLTPRKGDPDTLQLIHIDSKGVTTFLASTPLAPFVGVWVEAYEKITYSPAGQYSIAIKRLDDGTPLFSYSNSNLDLWRNGTTVIRPKWGIYRSLNHAEQLRDEQVLFDRFCLAKGTDDCVSEKTLPDFSLVATPRMPDVAPGDTASYSVDLAPRRGFAQDVALSVLGLPPGASATFTPATVTGGSGLASLSITTSSTTPPGQYSVVVSGISGVLSHASIVPFNVRLEAGGRLNRTGVAEWGMNSKGNNGVPESGFPDRACEARPICVAGVIFSGVIYRGFGREDFLKLFRIEADKDLLVDHQRRGRAAFVFMSKIVDGLRVEGNIALFEFHAFIAEKRFCPAARGTIRLRKNNDSKLLHEYQLPVIRSPRQRLSLRTARLLMATKRQRRREDFLLS